MSERNDFYIFQHIYFLKDGNSAFGVEFLGEVIRIWYWHEWKSSLIGAIFFTLFEEFLDDLVVRILRLFWEHYYKMNMMGTSRYLKFLVFKISVKHRFVFTPDLFLGFKEIRFTFGQMKLKVVLVFTLNEVDCHLFSIVGTGVFVDHLKPSFHDFFINFAHLLPRKMRPFL